MTTIAQLLNLLDESTFHSSKNHILKAEARRLMNLLLKKGQDEFKSKADWYELHVLNGFIYDEDLGRKDQISKSPLLSTLFILNVYGVYSKKGVKGWLCGPLEDVEIFN